MKTLSLVIPAHNEAESIANTITLFHEELLKEKIPHEIIVVNDSSKDDTEKIIKRLSKKIAQVKYRSNSYPRGFGFAVREGLEHFTGDYVAIVMADMSDNPQDLVCYYRKAEEGFDCIFGSRFIRGAKIVDYPLLKLFFNRITNNIIKILFLIKYNDVTNAFKLYKRETITGLKPFLSSHFNLTVELPLKAIVRGYTYAVIPSSWTNRKAGISKLKIKEMGGRYFFIILYCFLEKQLSMGDYKKEGTS